MLILEILLYLVIGFSAYMFVLVVSGMFYHPTTATTTKYHLPRIKVLLPAYKPDEVFLKVMKQLKRVSEKQPVEVFILFQYADFKYCEMAEKLGFNYEMKAFDHLSGNSYQHALRYLADYHTPVTSSDYVMILDKDNLIAADFFEELKKIDLSGFDVVQSVRRPLEVVKGLQVFDALSERLNDLMLRAGKCFWGYPAELSGSAALVRTKIFRHCIGQLDPKAPGFDKNFMVNLLSDYDALKTMFSNDLVVYEEKTAAQQNYDAQRLRWFGEQYYNAFYKAGKLWSQSLRGDFKCLDYWISLVRPPRVVLFAISFFLMIVDLWDSLPGILSVSFVLNFLTLLMVSFPFLDQIKISDLITGGWNMLQSNLQSALTALSKKNLGTFIHTR